MKFTGESQLKISVYGCHHFHLPGPSDVYFLSLGFVSSQSDSTGRAKPVEATDILKHKSLHSQSKLLWFEIDPVVKMSRMFFNETLFIVAAKLKCPQNDNQDYDMQVFLNGEQQQKKQSVTRRFRNSNVRLSKYRNCIYIPSTSCYFVIVSVAHNHFFCFKVILEVEVLLVEFFDRDLLLVEEKIDFVGTLSRFYVSLKSHLSLPMIICEIYLGTYKKYAFMLLLVCLFSADHFIFYQHLILCNVEGSLSLRFAF